MYQVGQNPLKDVDSRVFTRMLRKDGRMDGRTDGRMDGRTDMVKPVYPPTTLLWGV